MYYFGVDVGIFDTKSQHTTTPSGFKGPNPEKPLMSSSGEYLEFDGKYYIPTSERFAYEKDKTRSERALILTLFALAKEIDYQVTKARKDLTLKDKQRLVNNYKEIALGVGLPPTHYTRARIDELTNYYKKYLGNGIKFTWNDLEFNLTMKACRVYPQGAAAASEPSNSLRTKYPAYYLIDIGGYTVDIVKFVNDGIDGKWTSKEEGILKMYDEIISEVQMNYDITLENSHIEDILENRATIIADEVKQYIRQSAQKHADHILDISRQLGVEFKAYPIAFVGGGSLQLKDYIVRNSLINENNVIFLPDPCANAKGFARFIKAEVG